MDSAADSAAVANAFYAVRQKHYKISAEQTTRSAISAYRVIEQAHKNPKGVNLYALNPYLYFEQSIYADASFNFKTTNQKGKPVMYPTKEGVDYPDCSVRLYAVEFEKDGKPQTKCYNCFQTTKYKELKICDACYCCGCSRTPARVINNRKGTRHLIKK